MTMAWILYFMVTNIVIMLVMFLGIWWCCREATAAAMEARQQGNGGAYGMHNADAEEIEMETV